MSRALPWIFAAVIAVGILLALGVSPWGAALIALLPAGAEIAKRARQRAVEQTISEQRDREYETVRALDAKDHEIEARATEERHAIPPPPEPGRVLSDAEISAIVQRAKRSKRDPPS